MDPRRILVIDDNEDLADGLSELMELHKHEVDVVLTGGDGVRAAGRKSYDIIFVDIGLPDINGVECARMIKEGGSSAKIVLMTGYSAQDIPAQVNELDNTELLTKPIDPASILERIN
jgi:DNA-binding response OmpR family regulator